ncbi:beta-galactosidase-1-like protein 2 isoform X2 [Ambystoma mexicanum]|uniref:beta-galactosidase-1-like protein 2 isoform X2 n=1 Tax=Ambystoma mexicanum TaxID=8296 RepID=UPI0037E8B0C5
MRRVVRRRLWALSGVLTVLMLYRFDLLPFKLWPRQMGLQTDGSTFLLEGVPFRILGGSMHYFRVPREYWQDRMLKMKACGLNTLTTYVAWNMHEAAKGIYDFTGNLDLGAFLRIAEEVGLWVILRPGPYICAEWDFGGLPSWLLRDKKMKLRTTYPGFTAAVDAYFDHLIPTVLELQYKKGGPIIAVQVENEYGAYAKDSNYMEYVKTALLKRGIVEMLMTSDSKDGLSSGSLEGVLATVNFQKKENFLFSYLETLQSNMPKMVMEYWTGWFDQWGSDHHVYDADQMVRTVAEILNEGASINFYMFHGGTNFGFMNGATHFKEYLPHITSYDYDAPLTEAGEYTSKYHKLREILATIQGDQLPMPPIIMPKASYEMVTMTHYVSLWDVLHFTGEPYACDEPVNMENLPVNDGNGQSYGYTLYETLVYGGGVLNTMGNVLDRARIFINNQAMGIVDRNNHEVFIPEVPGYRKMRFLVENCGRVNYGTKLDEQRKGIVGDVVLRENPLRTFKIYSLDMNMTFIKSLNTAQWSSPPDDHEGPAFFRGTLNVHFTNLDTFLSMKGWKKGVVFVNGQNLGRYWDIGPQETLFVPGTWLRPGSNEIIIFEEFEGGQTLRSVDAPFLGRPYYVQ